MHGGDQPGGLGFRNRRNRPQLYHPTSTVENNNSSQQSSGASLLGITHSSPTLFTSSPAPAQKYQPPVPHSTNNQTSAFGFAAGWTSAVTGIAANLLDPKKDDNIVNPNSGSYHPQNQYSQSFGQTFAVDFGGFFDTGRNPTPPPSTFSSQEASSTTFTPTLLDVYEMPCRERTNEFMTAVKSIQMRQSANGFGQKPQKKVVTDALQFNQMAKRIGRDLSNTCAKLEKLTILGKKTSLFNDRMAEVEDLTAQVKYDITNLNKQIANLQQFVNSRHLEWKTTAPRPRTERSPDPDPDPPEDEPLLSSQTKSFGLVLAAEASDPDKRPRVLKLRTRRGDPGVKSLHSGNPFHGYPLARRPDMRRCSVLLAEEQDRAAAASGASSVALDMGDLEKSRMQQQVQLIDDQESYVQSRANTMENIESSIVELGTIFRQLATLVQEQGETVQRIDSNVEETGLNIDAAHGELLKYFQNISKNRWLMIKIFGVLFVFFIFFVVFLT